MSLVRTAVFALAGAALVGATLPAERAGTASSSPERTSASSARAVADTLRYQVRAGQPLLVALPARAGGREASYAVLSAPAMSWLVDRSFFWQTLPSERGLLPVVLRQTAATADTLVLLVEITE